MSYCKVNRKTCLHSRYPINVLTDWLKFVVVSWRIWKFFISKAKMGNFENTEIAIFSGWRHLNFLNENFTLETILIGCGVSCQSFMIKALIHKKILDFEKKIHLFSTHKCKFCCFCRFSKFFLKIIWLFFGKVSGSISRKTF